MAINNFFDETAGHGIVTGPMAEARPFLRSALLGCYIELISQAQKQAVAAVEAGTAAEHVAGIVSLGDIVAIEPFAFQEMVEFLIKYDYLERVEGADNRFRLRPHAKLAHWEDPKTLLWRRQQRQDVRDPVLRAAVRFRDGDQCRVCHVLVKWGAPDNDPEAATLDHINPRVLAYGDPEKLAVTCRRCNGLRSDRPDANSFAPHQPVPEHPFYTASTARYLRQRGYEGVRPTGQRWFLPLITILVPTQAPPEDAQRPASQADTADVSSDLAAGETTRASSTPADAQRPASQADTAAADGEPNHEGQSRPESDRSSPETRSATSPPEPANPRVRPPSSTPPPTGGEGMGRAGLGSGLGAGGGPAPPRPKAKPRAARRSRRGKPATPSQASPEGSSDA